MPTLHQHDATTSTRHGVRSDIFPPDAEPARKDGLALCLHDQATETATNRHWVPVTHRGVPDNFWLTPSEKQAQFALLNDSAIQRQWSAAGESSTTNESGLS